MYNVFFSAVMPLVSLGCFGLALFCVFRGLSQLVWRCRNLAVELHASSTVCRHTASGSCRYVPVFSYVDTRGDEVDIMGAEEYATQEEALQARRPLVYESERPDAPMALNPLTYVCRPLLFLLAAAGLLVACHFLLQYMPD